MSKTINVGIDLGTTNTLVFLQSNTGKIGPLNFKGSGNVLPSVLFYDNSQIVIGKTAINKGVTKPGNMIRSAKTEMGTNKCWTINGRNFTPVDVATEVLGEVKRRIEEMAKKWYPDEEIVIDAVITHPAYFDQSQVDDTKKAGLNAGINVKKLISEPMAAALAYITSVDEDMQSKPILVIDLGGGTFDLSLLKYDAQKNIYATIDTYGDKKLGGDDFDEILINNFKEIILNETDGEVDLTNADTAKKSGIEADEFYRINSTLRNEAEKLKIALSDDEYQDVLYTELFELPDGSTYDLDIGDYSREDFDRKSSVLYDRIFNSITEFAKRNNITVENLWSVALVGGSCNIPYIIERVQKMFPGKANAQKNLETVVAEGAYLASMDVPDTDPHKINYSDILSHSLGIRVEGDKFSTILKKQQPYPCEFTRTYSTTRDHQKSINVDLYETLDNDTSDFGLDEMPIDKCKYYGSLTIGNIKDGKKGEVKFDITIEYDESRQIIVSALELDTGKHRSILINKQTDPAKNETKRYMDIMLLVDRSGSMRFDKKMDKAKQASKKLVTEMVDLSSCRIGIASFGTTATIHVPLTDDSEKILTGIDEIPIEGMTYAAEALDYIGCKGFSDSEREKYIIMITDGHVDRESKARDSANAQKSKGICLITVGVGLDARGADFNTSIASDRSDGSKFSYNIDDMSELAEVFEMIIGELQLA